MSFSVIPTNVNGVSVSSILGPLGSLFDPKSNQVQNLMYPSDLGSNPSMSHAIIFQAFDRSSKLQNSINFANIVSSTYNTMTKKIDFTSLYNTFFDIGQTLEQSSAIDTLSSATELMQAPSYAPEHKSPPLTTISLFMPETLSLNYNSTYGEVNLTEELGNYGLVGNAISDSAKNTLKQSVIPYAIKKTSDIIGSKIGKSGDMGGIISQSQNVITNPQVQLLYRGIELRTFSLEFILTPKTSNEAQTVKDICDSFTYYSLPGIAGAQTGNSGQFLTPPQLFTVQFRFLGQNNIMGSVSNVISTALTNIGLGFLTNDTLITNGSTAKVYTVNDCVLENVSIDYAPNGWSSYNDGYPVQTRLTLNFKETMMITKQHFKDSRIEQNYSQKSTLSNLFNDSTGQ